MHDNSFRGSSTPADLQYHDRSWVHEEFHSCHEDDGNCDHEPVPLVPVSDPQYRVPVHLQARQHVVLRPRSPRAHSEARVPVISDVINDTSMDSDSRLLDGAQSEELDISDLPDGSSDAENASSYNGVGMDGEDIDG